MKHIQSGGDSAGIRNTSNLLVFSNDGVGIAPHVAELVEPRLRPHDSMPLQYTAVYGMVARLKWIKVSEGARTKRVIRFLP